MLPLWLFCCFNSKSSSKAFLGCNARNPWSSRSYYVSLSSSRMRSPASDLLDLIVREVRDPNYLVFFGVFDDFSVLPGMLSHCSSILANISLTWAAFCSIYYCLVSFVLSLPVSSIFYLLAFRMLCFLFVLRERRDPDEINECLRRPSETGVNASVNSLINFSASFCLWFSCT